MSNSNFSSIAFGTNGLQVTDAATPTPASDGSVPSREYGGATRVIIGPHGSTLSTHDAQMFDSSNLGNGHDGVLGTASVSARDMRPDDMVKLPNGMETSAAVAEKLGYLRSGPNGYENTTRGAPSGASEATSKATEAATEVAPVVDSSSSDDTPALDALSASAVAVLDGAIDTGLRTRALNEIVENGAVSEEAIGHAASTLGIPKEEASKLVMNAIRGRSDQAGTYLGQAGVVAPEDLWNWAKANAPTDLRNAVHAHMRDGRINAWDGLANAYLKDLDKRNPELAMKAYPHSRYDAGSKTVIVKTNAGETSWGAAIRAGLIGKR